MAGLKWTLKSPSSGITTVASTPVTALQYAASSSHPAKITGFKISQSGSTTSAMEQVSLIRKTAGATVTAGVVGTTIFDQMGNGSSSGLPFRGTLSTSATGVNASAEGTDGDLWRSWDFNVLSPLEILFAPDDYIWVPVSGIVGLKIKAVNALVYYCQLYIEEW